MGNVNTASKDQLNHTVDNTSFIGREKEYTDIQKLLAQPDCRLLTLVGPGGIGKTRLALQLSTQISADYARGSFVVYLQPLRSAEFFVAAVADGADCAMIGARSSTRSKSSSPPR